MSTKLARASRFTARSAVRREQVKVDGLIAITIRGDRARRAPASPRVGRRARLADLLTGATKLLITSSASTPPPSKAVVERMLAEAAAARAEDDQQRQVLDARVRLDAAIYSGRKVLADYKEKLPADVQARCERALEEAQRSLDASDLATLRNAMTKVQDAVHAATAALYRNAAPPH